MIFQLYSRPLWICQKYSKRAKYPTVGFILRVNWIMLGEMKNISFIHYYREFGGNMGTKRSEILQGSQFFWFGALFFSQNWVNFKNAQNWPKYSHFSVVFRSLFNFGWKTAHQTQNIEFSEEFRFFWYPYCPQTRDNSGAIISFMYGKLWWPSGQRRDAHLYHVFWRGFESPREPHYLAILC